MSKWTNFLKFSKVTTTEASQRWRTMSVEQKNRFVTFPPVQEELLIEEEQAPELEQMFDTERSVMVSVTDRVHIEDQYLVYNIAKQLIDDLSIPFNITIRAFSVDGLEFRQHRISKDYFEESIVWNRWWVHSWSDFNKTSSDTMLEHILNLNNQRRNELIEAGLEPIPEISYFIISVDKAFRPDPNLIREMNHKKGSVNCLISPIATYFKNAIKRTKNKKTINQYKAVCRKCRVLLKMFEETGVPESKIQWVSNTLKVNITIMDPIQGKAVDFKCKNSPIRKASFKYVNTEIDHVEISQYYRKRKVEYVDRETIDNMFKHLTDKNAFFTYVKTKMDGIIKINQIGVTYVYKSEFNEKCEKFEKINRLDEIKMCETSNPEISEFVRDGYHVAGCVDYFENLGFNTFAKINGIRKFKHIDQRKAYLQYKNNTFYEGFPAVFTDFRSIPETVPIDEVLNNIGYYRIYDIKFDSVTQNIAKHIDNLSLISDGIYPNVVLKFFKSVGVEFKINAGCWGVEPCHLSFEGEFTDKSFYPRYSGKMASMFKTTNISFNCDESFASIISQYYEDTFYFQEEHRLVVPIKIEKKIYHRTHIAGFITGYALIGMLQQLFLLDNSMVYRVNMDGIFYDEGHPEFDLINNFIEKENNFPQNVGCSNLIHVHDNARNYVPPAEYIKNNKISLYYGSGGSGKTHSALTELGFCGKLFTAIAWKLIREKRNEYTTEFDIATIASLMMKDVFFKNMVDSMLGKGWFIGPEELYTLTGSFDPKMKKFVIKKAGPNDETFGESMLKRADKLDKTVKRAAEFEIPGTIIVDEATMLSSGQYEMLLERFPFSKFIFCGDFDKDGTIYQLPQFTGKKFPINKIPEECMTEFPNNYRCECDKLADILKCLRDMTKKNERSDYVRELITQKMFHNGRIITKEQVKEMYNIEDFVLCSRRTCSLCKELDPNIFRANGSKCIHNHTGGNFCDEWTKFLAPKFAGKKKYLVKKSSGGHSTGEIIISDTPIDYGYLEERHGFTMHSIQGMTISNEKVFIDPRQLFDSRMMYIAFSRVKRIDQLYLIDIDDNLDLQRIKKSPFNNKFDFLTFVSDLCQDNQLVAINKFLETDEDKPEIFDELYQKYINHKIDLRNEKISLNKETVKADLDFENWTTDFDHHDYEISKVPKKYKCHRRPLRMCGVPVKLSWKDGKKKYNFPISWQTNRDQRLNMKHFDRNKSKVNVVNTGKVNNLIVIDLDLPKDPLNFKDDGRKNFYRLLEKEGILDKISTTIVKTGSGGEHWYFRLSDKHADIKNSANEIRGFPGIDVKSNGGGVTAPGSEYIRNGKLVKYRYFRKHPAYSRRIMDLPDELAKYLPKKKSINFEIQKITYENIKKRFRDKTTKDVSNQDPVLKNNQEKVIAEYLKNNPHWRLRKKTAYSRSYNRIRSSHCDLCDKTHDSDNTLFILTKSDGSVIRRCVKSKNFKVLLEPTFVDPYSMRNVKIGREICDTIPIKIVKEDPEPVIQHKPIDKSVIEKFEREQQNRIFGKQK